MEGVELVEIVWIACGRFEFLRSILTWKEIACHAHVGQLRHRSSRCKVADYWQLGLDDTAINDNL